MPGTKLAAVEFVVEDPPSSTDYRGLVNACCDAASHGIHALFANGYRAWLLLFGPALSADEWKRFPARRHGFGHLLREFDVFNDVMIEDDFFAPDHRDRTVGLYLVEPAKFADACWFQTVRETSTILVLSRRDEFLTKANLARLNDVIGFGAGFSPSVSTKFGTLSAAVCPLGDIVVKTVGAFDDKDRGVTFIYTEAAIKRGEMARRFRQELWRELERSLSALVQAVAPRIDRDNVETLKDLIENREYVVALEWLYDVVAGRSIRLTPEEQRDVERLSALMGISLRPSD